MPGIRIAGPAGALELFSDVPEGTQDPSSGAPDGTPRGLALVAHPQPLLGGSAQHKIPQFLARALAHAGWVAVRPNFRGVGASEGTHDGGAGETEDLQAALDWAQAQWPGLPLALLGFSFGAFVTARLADRLARAGRPAQRVVLAGCPAGPTASGRRYDPPAPAPHTLVVHGERDESVGLETVFAWCAPHGHPVVVVPAADHFFSGRLPVLRDLVLAHLGAAAPG